MARRRHTAEQIIIKLREAKVALVNGHPLTKATSRMQALKGPGDTVTPRRSICCE